MNEEIKEILQEVNKIIDNTSYNEDITYFEVSHISKLLDYITNLQQENERLKEENKSYQEYPFIIIEKNGVICSKNQEIEDYKSRCEKANTYINEEIKKIQEHQYSTGVRRLNKIQNILNGSDENETNS